MASDTKDTLEEKKIEESIGEPSLVSDVKELSKETNVASDDKLENVRNDLFNTENKSN